MLSSNPHCFGHPTKVTFTFADQCLKDESANYPPYASYWSGSPYRDSAPYNNIQSWLSHKMKTQREKLRLEKAVQRAEKKLKLEYDRQMETKRQAAEQRFKLWLKSKGFADQSPVMLHRIPHRCTPDSSVPTYNASPSTTALRPTTARGRSESYEGGNGRKPNRQRPKSASGSNNRKRIISTLDPKPPKTAITPCKSLGQDEYMKMRHIAGKRYKKLKEEKTEFQCEDQLLRKLQDLNWEEKCIKSKMVYAQKEDLDKVKAKALKKRKKKLKFRGDLITVEVEEIDSQADLDITFEEVDDKCSDIGCIEKEGVDFHIESRETIDLSDKPDDPVCRPMTAEPPRLECDPIPTAPARPKSSKPRQKVRSEDEEKKGGEKETAVKEKLANGSKIVPKNEEKSAKDSLSKDAKNLPKEATSPPKEKPTPPKEATFSPKEKPSPPKEKPSPPKEVTSPPKEATSPPKEKPSPPKEATSPPNEKPSPPKETTSPPKEATSPPKETTSPPKEATSPPKEKPSPPKEKPSSPKGVTSPPKEATSPPKEKPSPPKEETSPPKEKPSPPKGPTSPPNEKSSPKGTTSPPKEATSSPNVKPSPPKEKPSLPKEKPSPPKETTSSQKEKTSPPKEKPFPPKEKPSTPKEKPSPPKEKPSLPKEKPSPPKETTALPKQPAVGIIKEGKSEAVPKNDSKNSKGTVPKIVVQNGNHSSDESSVDEIPKKETKKNNTTDKTSSSDANVRDSKIASDSFFD